MSILPQKIHKLHLLFNLNINYQRCCPSAGASGF